MITERDIFLNTNDFAVEASWTPQGGEEATTLKGLFWSPGELVSIGEVNVSLENYMIELPSESVDGAGINSTCVVNGTTYYAIEFLPDGHGFTKVALSLDQV